MPNVKAIRFEIFNVQFLFFSLKKMEDLYLSVGPLTDTY